jgi:Rieske Fe-S protein
MLKTIIYKLTLLFLIMFLSSSSCDKDRFDFPYTPINLNIDLVSLYATIGAGEYAFMYDNYGVNGLLIRRNFDNQFFVYDRTCTYEPDFSCAVDSDTTSSLHISCPCCNSQYFLDETGDAFITRGPARYPLVRYNATINGGFLWVFN